MDAHILLLEIELDKWHNFIYLFFKIQNQEPQQMAAVTQDLNNTKTCHELLSDIITLLNEINRKNKNL